LAGSGLESKPLFMDTRLLLLIKRCLEGALCLCALTSGVLWFISAYLPQTTLCRQRNWIEEKWTVIQSSAWLLLPRRIILWLLRLNARARHELARSTIFLPLAIMSAPVLLGAQVWAHAALKNGSVRVGTWGVILCLFSAVFLQIGETVYLFLLLGVDSSEPRQSASPSTHTEVNGIHATKLRLSWFGVITPYLFFGIVSTLVLNWPSDFIKSIFAFVIAGILIACLLRFAVNARCQTENGCGFTMIYAVSTILGAVPFLVKS
jgi:hypothetical protein